ncbi:hypothetical protein NDU88_004841 [Pleurodeles waltl]|uniref:Uncharacterized protein n=1 Tax=Pleurodeles waltl TaxID=8319 RepID=A0AAV7W641_PLEWA|nr:hypothetical protein NDU88_004841 [Pleurodeles waltl]
MMGARGQGTTVTPGSARPRNALMKPQMEGRRVQPCRAEDTGLMGGSAAMAPPGTHAGSAGKRGCSVPFSPPRAGLQDPPQVCRTPRLAARSTTGAAAVTTTLAAGVAPRPTPMRGLADKATGGQVSALFSRSEGAISWHQGVPCFRRLLVPSRAVWGPATSSVLPCRCHHGPQYTGCDPDHRGAKQMRLQTVQASMASVVLSGSGGIRGRAASRIRQQDVLSRQLMQAKARGPSWQELGGPRKKTPVLSKLCGSGGNQCLRARPQP